MSLAVVVGCCGGHCGKTGAVKALPVWWGWVGYVLVGGVGGRYGVHHSGVQVGDGGVCAGETVAGEQVLFAAAVSVGVEIDHVVEVGADSSEAHQNAIPLVALFALAQRGGFVAEDVLRQAGGGGKVNRPVRPVQMLTCVEVWQVRSGHCLLPRLGALFRPIVADQCARQPGLGGRGERLLRVEDSQDFLVRVLRQAANVWWVVSGEHHRSHQWGVELVVG